MLKFYFNSSLNPTKVALILEESGLPYEPIPIDPRRGAQFSPEFLVVNPNAKVPAIVDDDVSVFDSSNPPVSRREDGQFPSAGEPEGRASRLMFVATGVGPFSGQAVHFKHFAPERVHYAHNRYQYEAQRHFTSVGLGYVRSARR